MCFSNHFIPVTSLLIGFLLSLPRRSGTSITVLHAWGTAPSMAVRTQLLYLSDPGCFVWSRIVILHLSDFSAVFPL